MSLALIGALFIGTPAAVYAVANDIYVGSNDSDGGGSCADPDFSTDVSDEGSINAALDASLAAVDDDGDSVIICDGDYTYAADITLHNGAVGHGVINIEAAAGADVTLDGGDLWQLLKFANMTSVSVTGIGFLDAQVDTNGAAIQIMGGTLNIVDCSFANGGTATIDGGAIYSNPGHVTISGSTFTDNRAGDEGGAIAVQSAVDGTGVTVADSLFTGNSEAEGAAISVNGVLSAAIITVTDSEFVNNDGEYGAITIDGGTVELTNVVMDGNNNTSGEGGAVWAGEGLTVRHSEFTNNSSADDDGGALYNADGSLEVTNSQFTNNSSGEDDEGGAIAVENCDEVSVSGSKFLRNSAGDQGGGAINFDCDADADVLVSRNTFTGNSARSYGGAIDQEDNDFVIRYVRNTFTSNSVTDGTIAPFGQVGGQGGAVWVYNATFSGNRFTRNRASEFGGAVYATDSRVARAAKRSTFSGNRARRGSDVYLSRGD
jgi:predicted outer membrane repeat protein